MPDRADKQQALDIVIDVGLLIAPYPIVLVPTPAGFDAQLPVEALARLAQKLYEDAHVVRH